MTRGSAATRGLWVLLALAVVPTLALIMPGGLAGCRARPSHGGAEAAFIVTVRNDGPDIHQLEVDYPNASFGRDLLGSGASFNYPPKLIGSGPIKVTFTDNQGKSHTATGPTIQEGLRKTLVISIGENENVVFQDLPSQAR